jgi:uncharacterized surface protein with fasciclin (FAS1) repeats
MRPTTSTRTNRRSRRPGRAFAAVAVSGGLLLAACGGDDDSSDTTTAAATEAPAATDAPSATSAQTPATTATDDSMSGGDMMGATGPGCASVPTDGEGSFDGMADDPAATAASNNPLLSTLVAAVTEAGLGDTLNGEGPFTIFAPTNDAFAKIPSADLDAVLADKELLTSILTYHVIGEQLSADDLIADGTATTVNGAELTFTEGTDGALMVNDATSICMNVPTANATVHIIDTVLMPAAEGASEEMMGATGPGCAAVPTSGEGSFDGMADDPAATAASNNPLLSTLVSAVTAAGLGDTLNGEGPFTIFAPTNDAFAKIPSADLNAVLADTDLLTSILTYHVIGGEQLSADDLIAEGTATTVNGAELTFSEGTDGALMINDATSICMNVPTANATVHIIDTVLMPAS